MERKHNTKRRRLNKRVVALEDLGLCKDVANMICEYSPEPPRHTACGICGCHLTNQSKHHWEISYNHAEIYGYYPIVSCDRMNHSYHCKYYTAFEYIPSLKVNWDLPPPLRVQNLAYQSDLYNPTLLTKAEMYKLQKLYLDPKRIKYNNWINNNGH